MVFEQAPTVNEIVPSEIFEIDGHKVFPYHAILNKCLRHDNFSALS
jgi:hypothetical protein